MSKKQGGSTGSRQTLLTGILLSVVEWSKRNTGTRDGAAEFQNPRTLE